MAWLLLLVSTLSVLWVSSLWMKLRRNIAIAKQIGLPYIIVPIWYQFLPWFLLQEEFVPVLKRLPTWLTEPWLSAVVFGRSWNYGYKPFENISSDSFLTVAPGGIALLTCDVKVVNAVVTRGREFSKPTEMMQILNVYGPTITAAEGETARRYRKLATPSFNESTHKAVWNYAINETSTVEDRWRQQGPDKLGPDVTRMALHIISAAGLGRQMAWSDTGVPPGHTLNFTDAITKGLAAMPAIYGTPRWLLRWSPTEGLKQTYQAFTEWIKYMEEMRDEKQNELRVKGPTDETLNLLGSVVHAGDYKDRVSLDNEEPIPPEAVLGNIFILTFVGHDTSANTMAFALMILAYFPKLQKRVQQELDDVFGTKSPDQWSYEQDFPKLGLLSAVFNEALRHYSVVPLLPKSTGSQPRSLDIGSSTYTIPANVPVLIHSSGVHRHPKIWPQPSTPEPGESAPYPLSGFQPDLWLDKDFTSGLPQNSFIPFSAGSRGCMGQKFARVQFAATVARLLHSNTLEIDAGHGARPDASRQQQWMDARKALAHQLSGGVDVRMGMKAVETVRISLVNRGDEKWTDLY